MFFGKNTQKAISTETLATLMDTSVKIEGNFFFDKSARLDGVIIGNIRGPNTKSGVLIIGPKAQIDGSFTFIILVSSTIMSKFINSIM